LSGWASTVIAVPADQGSLQPGSRDEDPGSPPGTLPSSEESADPKGNPPPVASPVVTLGPNLVGNPSFEVNTTGWAASSRATLSRISGGFEGGFALRVLPPSGTGSFEVHDAASWVTPTA